LLELMCDSMLRKETKVGLALGGGAAKGIAHIGVLKALQEAGIPIHLVVGTSMGALIGALFCQKRDAKEVESAVQTALTSDNLARVAVDIENLTMSARDKREYSLLDTFKKLHLYYQAFRNYGVVEDKKVIVAISNLLPESSIEILQPKFAAVATDLYSGEPLVISKGSLREAVRASISVPLLFPPVDSNGKLLVDGMVTSLVPVEEALRLGAKVVIAVDVQGPVERQEGPQNAVEVMVRCEGISSYQLKRRSLEKADIVIRPFPELVKSWDFRNADEYIEMGKRAANQEIENIRKVLETKTKRHVWEGLLKIFRGKQKVPH